MLKTKGWSDIAKAGKLWGKKKIFFQNFKKKGSIFSFFLNQIFNQSLINQNIFSNLKSIELTSFISSMPFRPLTLPKLFFFRTLKSIKTNHSTFYPELHDFDPIRVCRQKTLSFQINKNKQKLFFSFLLNLSLSLPLHIKTTQTLRSLRGGMRWCRSQWGG